METQYSSLAELRSSLTADNPDERASAYGAVMEHDLKPSQVLVDNPDEEVVEALADSGVIPEQAVSGGRPAANREEEKLEVLKEIRDAVQGGGA